MEWLANNWYLIIGLLAVVICVVLAIARFMHLPTKEQINSIKEWLLYAVIEAEKKLGSDTGKVKLKTVYDWALAKFPWLSFIPFITFSDWVDDALDEMRHLLETNERIADYVHTK